MKGRYFWNKRTEDGFRKAIEYFQRAIDKDPNYAEAYAGLADAYMLLGGYGLEPQKEVIPKAKAAAQKALTLDDQLAETYTSLGMISEAEWNWTETEKNYKRAIEINPNYSVAHQFYGDGYFSLVSKIDEAISELRKAHELDPVSPMIATDLATRLCEAHRYDEGIALFQKVLDVDHDFNEAHGHLSAAYERMGRYPEAIAELEKIKSWESFSFAKAQMAYIYAVQGRRKEALEIADELRRRSAEQYVDPIYFVRIYAALGEKDLAFDRLQAAYEKHDPGILSLKEDSAYEPLRADPRFGEMVERIGCRDGGGGFDAELAGTQFSFGEIAVI
jgi:tetratricopeptide (TPR) repeat protein